MGPPHPNAPLIDQDERAYFSQLLTILSPVKVFVQKYGDVGSDPALTHPDFVPQHDDYVITIQLPLVSRFKLSGATGPRLPRKPFNLVVQEISYVSTVTDVSTTGAMEPIETTYLGETTPLTKVIARSSIPNDSMVRFVVKRELKEKGYKIGGFSETVETRVRVGLQAVIDTELGPMVFPTPLYEDYEIFDISRHSVPPSKTRKLLDPYSQPKSPYWFFAEVTT